MTKSLKIDCNENIILTQITLTDSIDIFNTINTQREYLGKWLPFVEYTKELKDSEYFVNSVINIPEEKMEFTFVIKYKDQFAGIIGIKSTEPLNKKTEIGYWLSEPFQNKGIMLRSVKCLINYVFSVLDFNRIQIKVAVGNNKSSNIPKKLGFSFEGIEREGELSSNGKFFDIEVYSLLKKEFTEK